MEIIVYKFQRSKKATKIWRNLPHGFDVMYLVSYLVMTKS